MNKTVFITGASSGIGKATAVYFNQKGWNVIATMRKPENENDLLDLNNVELIKLDVTDLKSIEIAVKQSLERFRKIDVVINNAGYGLLGPLENASSEQIKSQFDTNLIGTINVIKAFIPYFKTLNEGMFINVSSMLGRITLPFFSVYASSKFAVEGLSEALRYEFEDSNIKIKLIEPGTIKTNFNKSEQLTLEDLDKNPRFKKVIEGINKKGESGVEPSVVARVIFKAANDKSNKFRYLTDGTGRLLVTLRNILPLGVFQSLMKRIIG